MKEFSLNLYPLIVQDNTIPTAISKAEKMAQESTQVLKSLIVQVNHLVIQER